MAGSIDGIVAGLHINLSATDGDGTFRLQSLMVFGIDIDRAARNGDITIGFHTFGVLMTRR